jgi:hypothetical protein
MTAVAPQVVFAGENPLIMLYRPGGDDLVAVASLWRARYTERGAGTSLIIWTDPGPSAPDGSSAPGGPSAPDGPAAPDIAAICTDNPPLAHWLWTTFNRRWEPLLGRGLEDAPLRAAQFTETASFGEHRLLCRSEGLSIELSWRRPQPCVWTDTRPYEYRTTAAIVPCLEATIEIDGLPAYGEVRPHDDAFVSSAVLAFCETWLTRPEDQPSAP